jgi:hypothetical protein
VQRCLPQGASRARLAPRSCGGRGGAEPRPQRRARHPTQPSQKQTAARWPHKSDPNQSINLPDEKRGVVSALRLLLLGSRRQQPTKVVVQRGPGPEEWCCPAAEATSSLCLRLLPAHSGKGGGVVWGVGGVWGEGVDGEKLPHARTGAGTVHLTQTHKCHSHGERLMRTKEDRARGRGKGDAQLRSSRTARRC